jgi:hypothetical protein
MKLLRSSSVTIGYKLENVSTRCNITLNLYHRRYRDQLILDDTSESRLSKDDLRTRFACVLVE